jgi:hypothetical protein
LDHPTPGYYISEVLHDSKTRYLEVHKLLYAVLTASRKPRHYFQDHKISVVTSYPLKAVFHNPNATRNIAEWAAELAEFELDFLPRHAVKSHVKEPEVKTPIFTKPHWTFFFNGSSCKQGARVGVLLLTPSG